jgi:hypothetical protein
LKAHLKRTLHARPIAREKLGGCAWVKASEHPVKMFSPAPLPYAREARAQSRVRPGADKEGMTKGAQVKARPADKKDHVSASFNLINLCKRVARPVASRIVDFRRHEINQMVPNASPHVKWNFSRSNINLPIDLNGIAVDDLASEAQGERYAQIAFT